MERGSYSQTICVTWLLQVLRWLITRHLHRDLLLAAQHRSRQQSCSSRSICQRRFFSWKNFHFHSAVNTKSRWIAKERQDGKALNICFDRADLCWCLLDKSGNSVWPERYQSCWFFFFSVFNFFTVNATWPLAFILFVQDGKIGIFLAMSFFFSLELILHWYVYSDISDVSCNFAQG